MSDAARWKATVHVGGLSQFAEAYHVRDAFMPFGEIVEIQVPKNDNPNSTDLHRGFAYVEYEDSADAKEAINNMNNCRFFDKVLKVSQAKAPKSAEEGLGSKTAIWEKEGWLAEHAADDNSRVSHDLSKVAPDAGPDPMQGLEGLDVAGPKPE